MPRNSSGTYTLPIGAFSPGGLIKSADHNSNYSDIATALTQSLATTGVSSMTGQIKAASGTAVAPGYAFGTDLTSGLWLAGSHQIGVTTNGTQLATFNSDQTVTWAKGASWAGNLSITGTITQSGALTVSAGGAAITGNSTVTGTLTASSTLTASNGFTVSAGTVTFPANSISVAAINITDVTVQRFTAGVGQTYNTPANVKRVRIRMVAGGGGGGAQATNPGSNGTDSSFGGWSCVHGNGGPSGGANAAGGSGGTGGTTGTGTLIVRWPGGVGGPSNNGGGSPITGNGGSTGFGLPTFTAAHTVTGTAAIGNSGSGGAGGGTLATANGGGGGGGEYIEVWMTAAQLGASQSVNVGSGGNGGGAGTVAGGNGAGGLVIVEEFYI